MPSTPPPRSPTLPSPLVVTSTPLTHEGFAPFGSVVMAERGDVVGKPANQGTAARFNQLASIENLRGDATSRARLNLCVFRCAPRTDWPMDVALLEKHALSTQVFVPMNARRYLVLVAEPLANVDAPDLSTLRAFVADGRQGIAYLPGTWHHPLIALDAETDFGCMVWEDGTDDDCKVVSFDESSRPRVVL